MFLESIAQSLSSSASANHQLATMRIKMRTNEGESVDECSTSLYSQNEFIFISLRHKRDSELDDICLAVFASFCLFINFRSSEKKERHHRHQCGKFIAQIFTFYCCRIGRSRIIKLNENEK